MSKDLKELELIVAMLKNDNAVARINAALIEQENAALEELAQNEEKAEQLLENPVAENIDAVVDYFTNIGNFIDRS